MFCPGLPTTRDSGELVADFGFVSWIFREKGRHECGSPQSGPGIGGGDTSVTVVGAKWRGGHRVGQQESLGLNRESIESHDVRADRTGDGIGAIGDRRRPPGGFVGR